MSRETQDIVSHGDTACQFGQYLAEAKSLCRRSGRGNESKEKEHANLPATY